MLFDIDHLATQCASILASLPEYPEVEQGTLKLSKSRGETGRTERWYNPRIGRLLYTENPMPIEYPVLEQLDVDNWITWMSGSPDECLAMSSMARSASGQVLIGGLGLGILGWLCASKPTVRSVTVVEIQQGVIDIVGPVIDHPKISIVRGNVGEYLDTTSARYDFIGLDTWPDVGSAVSKAQRVKARAGRALTRNGLVRTWLDEIADRLTQNDTLAKAAKKAQETRGEMLDTPKMIGDQACDFCGANPFIDCYGFCIECFTNTGVRDMAGAEVTEMTYRLLARAHGGELDYLAEPYPDMYEYIVGLRSAR